MDSSWQGNLPANRKKAIDELVRGQEVAAQLKLVVNRSIGVDESVFAEDLVEKIMNSFNSSLYMLNGGEFDEVASQIPQVGSPCWDGRKSSKDSGESGKGTAELKVKDRRGCYKRRKSSHSRTDDSTTLTDDGHAWRKYGQKVILNAKFPRNYFRCTHKYDQQCQAIKQVQRIQEEPPLYRTTYYGHHTCKNLLKASQFVLDPRDHRDDIDSSVLISFNSNGDHASNKPSDSLLASFQTVKQECCHKEDNMNMPSYDPITQYNNQASSSDYLLSPDDYMSAFDHGDVISGVNSSCTTSSHSLDMDGIMMESADFDDDGVFGF
ncbi:hypothetical protein NC651_035974 [Populus alba x Populus x berolinensis]|nr:hypothetical protein NC651_035974 [Populus alba x Populus x berolinensis]